MYEREDCIGVIQLTALLHSKAPSEVTTTDYKKVGFLPSLPVIFDRFESWEDATRAANDMPQQVPDHVPQYYRGIAALRYARDVTGHPVTGIDYRDEINPPIPYVDIISIFGSWTQAKIEACIHTPEDDPPHTVKSLQREENSRRNRNQTQPEL